MSALIGDREAVSAYLASREGRYAAREMARTIFENEERLAAYEIGEPGDLFPAVERELLALIEQRNREDRA